MPASLRPPQPSSNVLGYGAARVSLQKGMSRPFTTACLAVLLCTLVHAMAASAAPAQEAPGEQRPSLLGALKDAGQFNTLARLLDATGLSEVLESEARFTLLAPTDEAFRLLSESMLDEMLAEPGQRTLRTLLLNHLVRGEVTAQRLTTGEVTELKSVGGGAIRVQLQEDQLLLNGILVSVPGVDARNGVIHVIDGVIGHSPQQPRQVRQARHGADSGDRRDTPPTRDGGAAQQGSGGGTSGAGAGGSSAGGNSGSAGGAGTGGGNGSASGSSGASGSGSGSGAGSGSAGGSGGGGAPGG